MHPMKGQKMYMGNSTARLRETGSMRYSESNGIHIVEVGDVVWWKIALLFSSKQETAEVECS